jgi:hypothetical protein
MPSILGQDDGSGFGVKGTSNSGMGVVGESIDRIGVSGQSETGRGVSGSSKDFDGVFGASDSGDGVRGITASLSGAGASGVHGINQGKGNGVLGRSKNGNGWPELSTMKKPAVF